MNGVDLLRRAAILVREAAQEATPGPWKPRGRSVIDDQDMEFVEALRHDVRHIALWHPCVALAVAAWLDDEADDLAELQDTVRPTVYAARHTHHDFNPALRTAHALLQEI